MKLKVSSLYCSGYKLNSVFKKDERKTVTAYLINLMSYSNTLSLLNLCKLSPLKN